MSNAAMRELPSDMSLVQTVNSTKCSNYAGHGLDNSLWMAAVLILSSIVLLVLVGFNHIFASSGKKGAAAFEKTVLAAEKKPSEEKTPSSVIDLLLLSSFIIVLACSTFVVILFRKRITKGIRPISLEQGKEAMSPISMKAKSATDEHEIHYGGRPSLEGTIAAF